VLIDVHRRCQLASPRACVIGVTVGPRAVNRRAVETGRR
jgi:hypothetical protein